MLICTRKILQNEFNLLLKIFSMVYIALSYFPTVYFVWCYVVFVLWNIIISQRNIRKLHEYEVSIKMIKLGKYFIKWQNLICFYHCCFSYEVMRLFLILENKFWEVKVEKNILLMSAQHQNEINEECEIHVQCHHFTGHNQIAQITRKP